MSKSQSSEVRFIEISWPTLGVTVIGELDVAANPELVEEFWSHLPFRSLFLHPVAGGEIMYTWAPIVSTAPIRTRALVKDAPIGQIRYSPGGGNKFGIQYGASEEPSLTPVLGSVVAEDIDKLARVGHAIWESVFWRKTPIYVEVKRHSVEPHQSVSLDSSTLSSPLREILEEADELLINEPIDVQRLRNGDVAGGSYGQYFSVWHMAHSQLHSFAVSHLLPMLALIDKLELEDFKVAYETLTPRTTYLGFLAFQRLNEHQEATRKIILAASDREEARLALVVMCRYALGTCAWSFFHFPWYLGTFFGKGGAAGVLPGRISNFANATDAVNIAASETGNYNG